MVTITTRLVTPPHKETSQVTAAKIDPPRGRPNIGHIVIPYIQGLGECIKNVCTKYGIQTHFKGNNTLRQVLVKPKDQDPKGKKSGVIYSYQCGATDCGEEYIGETSRTLGECYREHLNEPSPIHVHSLHTDHQLRRDQFNIIGREDQDLSRLIKETIYIRVNNPTLNRNIGKFNLIHIWNRSSLVPLTLKQPFPNAMCTYANSYYISCSYVGLSSDLKTSTVVDESLPVSNQCSVMRIHSTIIWHIFVFPFMAITFEILYTCVSIHNANVYEVLNELQILTSHVCSFIFKIFQGFLACHRHLFSEMHMQSYEVGSDMQKCLTFCSLIYSFISKII